MIAIRVQALDALCSIIARPRSNLLSALTIIVAVGTFAVVSSLASGMSDLVGRRFDSLGDRALSLVASSRERAFVPTENDLAVLARLPQIERAALVRQFSGNGTLVEANGKHRVAVVMGVSRDYLLIDKLTLSKGDLLDFRGRHALIGSTLARIFFRGAESAIGQYIRVDGGYFQVVGVLAETDEPGRFVSDDFAVVLPLAAATTLRDFPEASGRILIQGQNGVDPALVGDLSKSALVAALPGDHRREDIAVWTKQALVTGAREVRRSQARAASLASMLATVVAMLGVASMLYLACDERRLEIGIRRGLGAQRIDIAIMFLAEATILCIISIPVGLLLGRAAAEVISGILSLKVVPSLDGSTVLIAGVSTSCLVLLASLGPALHAAKLDPASCLRNG